jgi:hypothetical protein
MDTASRSERVQCRERPVKAAIDDDSTVREALQVVRTAVPDFDPVVCERLKRGKSDVFVVRDSSGLRPLVAKCARKDTISIEHRVLTWLEAAPFPTVLARGTTDAWRPGRAWLVSDHAVGEPYAALSPVHRHIAGAWMADLHVWAALVPTPNLPSRDSEYHRNIVREACATLTDALAGGGALSIQETSTVGALKEMSLGVLDLWNEVGVVLRSLPATIVHSGFGGKNVRVACDSGQPAVLAFDWEQAGWGCPAADMSMVDLRSYAVRARRGGIDLPDPRLLRAIGELLWCFAAIPGERPNLLGAWPHRAAGKLGFYLDRVRAAMLIFKAGG